MQRVLIAFVVPLLAIPVYASDWYVDAVNGSNLNNGSSPASAWKTLTWARAHVPASGLEVIHMAPGVYGAALGESFPIDMRPDLQIVGDQGPSVTELDGSGANVTLITFESSVGGNGWSIGPMTQLRGLKLRNAATGISISSTWNAVSPTLIDLEVEQMSQGVQLFAGAYPCCGSSAATLERVRVRGCAVGLFAAGASTSSGVNATLSDCDFSVNSGPGIWISSGGVVFLTMDRCRIERNGSHGFDVDAFNYGGARGTLRDCSVSGNGVDGWSAPTAFALGGGRHADFTRCTVASNAVGVSGHRDSGSGGMFDTLKLRDCILHDNADDVAFTNYDPGYTPLVQGCEIGDGDFAGVNGNFAADPLFVDAAAGDWRLRFGSPCVDTAYNAPPTGTLDVAGRPRDVDGDLNTSELADRGAHEFRPLEIVGTAQLGTVLQWRLWGPPGNPCTLYWTRSDIASSPSSTPFGDLDLETALVRVFRVTTAGAPTVLQRQIPNVSALVGQTFAFQSLTDNVAAPNGKAYSNAVQITIVP